jgi:hypothetical protein
MDEADERKRTFLAPEPGGQDQQPVQFEAVGRAVVNTFLHAPGDGA